MERKINPRHTPELDRLREVAAQIIHHNRRISDVIIEVASYYRGEEDAQVPTDDQSLERQLNAKCNGADQRLRALAEACKAFPQGNCPKDVLDVLFKSTMRLIDQIESVHRARAINISRTVLTDCHNYLTIPDVKEVPPEENAKIIDKHFTRLIKRFCQNSDVFYDLATDIGEQRRKNASKKKSSRNPRKGSGHHGLRTEAMARQFEDFKTFLITHPISERRQGESISARAQQFWFEHEKEFTKMANQTGEKRGYRNANALASAYRTSRR